MSEHADSKNDAHEGTASKLIHYIEELTGGPFVKAAAYLCDEVRSDICNPLAVVILTAGDRLRSARDKLAAVQKESAHV